MSLKPFWRRPVIRGRKRACPGGSRRRAAPPRLEHLEQRTVPSGSLGINDVTVTQGQIGQTVSGTLDPGSRAEAYRLDGSAGERVAFHWVGGSAFQGVWSLFGPAA